MLGWATAACGVADAAAVLALLRGEDWKAEEYSWDASALDVGILTILRVAVVLVLAVTLGSRKAGTGSRGARAVGAGVAFVAACAVFGVCKLAAAHGLHKRHDKALLGVSLSVGFAVVEVALVGLLFSSSAKPSASSAVGQEDGAHTVQEGAAADEFAYMRLSHGDDHLHGQGASFRRVVSLAWPERYLLSIALVCLVVSSASQMIVPTLFGRIIDTISNSHDEAELNRIVLVMVLVFIVSSIFGMFRGALFNLSGERLVARFRVRVFESVIKQDVAFFDVSQSGELQSRLSNDTTVIQDAVTSNVSMGLRWLAQAVVGITILFALSWKLTLIMLSVIPALAIGARAYGMFIRDLSKNYQTALAGAGETAEQAFSSIRTVRSFSKESHEINRYGTRIMESYSYGVKKSWAYGAFIGGIGLAAYLAIALVLWYGGKLVISGSRDLDAAKLTAFLLYTIYIAVALGGLSGLYSQLMSAVGASERMFALIDRDPAILTTMVSDTAQGQIPSTKLKGQVEFRGVSFSYPSRSDVEVLKNVSFRCDVGQVTALVGESGGGKSSICNLLLRFYDPNAGAVMIDGRDLRSMTTVELHNSVSIVSQMPTLFSMTIEDNIKYGVHREVTEDEVFEAAKQANCFDFVSKFPEGFKTMVGERGVTLSGGQRQRIAIARALLAAPSVLLLDESTSALDAESEFLVQQALDKIMQDSNTTVLVVAHRLSSVQNADNILVMSKGEIVEHGTHTELMARQDDGGVYAALVKRQLQRTE